MVGFWVTLASVVGLMGYGANYSTEVEPHSSIVLHAISNGLKQGFIQSKEDVKQAVSKAAAGVVDEIIRSLQDVEYAAVAEAADGLEPSRVLAKSIGFENIEDRMELEIETVQHVAKAIQMDIGGQEECRLCVQGGLDLYIGWGDVSHPSQVGAYSCDNTQEMIVDIRNGTRQGTGWPVLLYTTIHDCFYPQWMELYHLNSSVDPILLRAFGHARPLLVELDYRQQRIRRMAESHKNSISEE